MLAKLKDIDLPRNVRLVAFQFALNAPVSAALRPWAVPWIKAMADFALAPLPEGEAGRPLQAEQLMRPKCIRFHAIWGLYFFMQHTAGVCLPS